MKNEFELRNALRHGLVQTAVAARMYVDTHEMEDGDAEKMSDIIVDELKKAIDNVLTLPPNEFAGLVEIEAIGAEGYQKAVEEATNMSEALKKDGEPTHIC